MARTAQRLEKGTATCSMAVAVAALGFRTRHHPALDSEIASRRENKWQVCGVKKSNSVFSSIDRE